MTEHDPAPQHSAEGLDEDTGPVPILAVVVDSTDLDKNAVVARIVDLARSAVSVGEAR